MESRHQTPSLPRNEDVVDQAMMRRPIRSTWQETRDVLLGHEAVMMTLLGSVSVMAVFPQSYLAVIPAALLYYSWATSRRFRLPFRLPSVWAGTDYGAPRPDGKSFDQSQGVLYFGQDIDSSEELWIDKGDAVRHGFVVGTTGSGKALPNDTPVLTPRGWVRIDELSPGDAVMHASGRPTQITSVHPQGDKRVARIWFGDGRHADCCFEHLWQVSVTPRAKHNMPEGVPDTPQVMSSADIGILVGQHGGHLHVTVPRATPHSGHTIDPRCDDPGQVEAAAGPLSRADARQAARHGFSSLGYMPSLHGTPEQRRRFMRDWLEAAGLATVVEPHGVRIKGLTAHLDASMVKHIVWSLGGVATSYLRSSDKERRYGFDLVVLFDEIAEVLPDQAEAVASCRYPGDGTGLEITHVERLDEDQPMTCIRIAADDGLFVMDRHLVTHNTELLLGIVSQTMNWSSGFMFVDGKGDKSFYTRSWSLAKRFGREDDVRVINFTDPGGDPDAPSGGPDTQSNTLNPFAKGTSDQLMNIVVSLMGDAGQGNDIWKKRAVALIAAELRALTELRDRGDILLNVQTIRDFLALGRGFDKSLTRGARTLEDVPEEAWNELRTRSGMTELYLRALNGEFSGSTLLAMQGFFTTLPMFSLNKAISGEEQDGKVSEQHGYLSMQMTQPLSSLADGYGHIFRTPLSEVDLNDIVLNRRILIVLLPALLKSEEEMKNCGKIIITLVKIMMGTADTGDLQGSKLEVLDARQTNSRTPFISILDEAGYYLSSGADVISAQARSFGFMFVVAGQDMAALQKDSAQLAETVIANASILAIGKTVDADKTLSFIQKVFGKAQVAMSAGYQSKPGTVGNQWVDRMEASFQEVERVRVDELQKLRPGEFYFLYNGTIVHSTTFYIGEVYSDSFSINKFIKVRGPLDTAPNLNQSREIAYLSSFVNGIRHLSDIADAGSPFRSSGDSDHLDNLAVAQSVNAMLEWKSRKRRSRPDIRFKCAFAAVAHACRPPDMMNNWETEEDLDDAIMDEMVNGPSDTGGPHRMLSDDHLADPGAENGSSPSEEPVRDTGRRAPPAFSQRRSDVGRSSAPPGADPEVAQSREAVAPRDLATSLESVTHERPGQRYRGLVDILVEQDAAARKARENNLLAPQQDLMEKERFEYEKRSVKTLAEFLQEQLDRRDEIASMLDEEDVDGEFAREIMARAGNRHPVPLSRLRNPEKVANTLEHLEQIAGVRSK